MLYNASAYRGEFNSYWLIILLACIFCSSVALVVSGVTKD